ncbi:hypothetical protein E4U55_007405 [Claviceps digitariae]|nr:hypothetical protein E4U55_007405 [Claviceps digitariae]
MPTRRLFTSITPLPRDLTRDAAIAFLHDHVSMIDLNPLIQQRHRIPPPPHCLDDERGCAWYSLTDKVAYLPGGFGPDHITYTCAFHDLPRGLQTHCYAPLGVETRSKWSVGGCVPGEPVELGVGVPAQGLYLREDVDLRCNILVAGLVKKTILKSHGVLVERLTEAARRKGEMGTSAPGGGDGGTTQDGRACCRDVSTAEAFVEGSSQSGR